MQPKQCQQRNIFCIFSIYSLNRISFYYEKFIGFYPSHSICVFVSVTGFCFLIWTRCSSFFQILLSKCVPSWLSSPSCHFFVFNNISSFMTCLCLCSICSYIHLLKLVLAPYFNVPFHFIYNYGSPHPPFLYYSQ